jgi:tuberculosinol/isotuberculosinol synthase
MEHIDRDKFLNLPVEEVAKLVRASGSKVVVFPINGTRRWFMLEYGEAEFEDPVAAYMEIAMNRHIELYKLFFDHGIETLITPVIGPEILATRNEYMQKIGGEGLARIATHPTFL